jgi:hypothetical protein
MCLGAWSILGFVKDMDLKSVVSLPEIPEGEEEDRLSENWDNIAENLE